VSGGTAGRKTCSSGSGVLCEIEGAVLQNAPVAAATTTWHVGKPKSWRADAGKPLGRGNKAALAKTEEVRVTKIACDLKSANSASFFHAVPH
jgi:hypothetical protein